jgi:hypothetical protein
MLSDKATILFYTYIFSPPAIMGRTDFGDSSLITRKEMANLFAIHSSDVPVDPRIFY